MPTGEMPDLLEYLQQEYEKEGESIRPDAEQFIRWARNYLSQHRPYQTFTVSANCGLVLSGGIALQLCPTQNNEPQVSRSVSISII